MMNIQNATILVTDRCNSKCTMCDIWNRKKRVELNADQYYAMFSTPAFSGLKDVNISGGEATLRPDLADVTSAILHGKTLEMFFLSTNGTNKETAIDCINAAKPFTDKLYLCVSIDGDRQTNKAVRGIDSYDQALETLTYAKSINDKIITNISLTLSPQNTNIETLNHIKTLAENTGSTYSFRFAYISNYFNNQTSLHISDATPDNVNLVKAFILENTFADPFMKVQYEYLCSGEIPIMKQGDNICCKAGNTFVLIAPNGDVFPCVNSCHPIGNFIQGITEEDYHPGRYESCPCCMELCVWPNISW